MWGLLLVLWLILLLQIRARSLRTAAAAYFGQAVTVFGLCAYEAFQGTGSEEVRSYWIMLGFLMTVLLPAALALSARREAAALAVAQGKKEAGEDFFAADKVSIAAALGMGTGYVLLDTLLPFVAGREYMATGGAFFLAGLGMILLSAGKTTRLIGLCSLGNGLFLFCFLLFREAPEIMQGMLLVQIIIATVIMGLTFHRGPV